MHEINKILSVYTESLKKTSHKERHTMSKILKFVWSVLLSISEASYAAHLARNGQHTRAKALYK